VDNKVRGQFGELAAKARRRVDLDGQRDGARERDMMPVRAQNHVPAFAHRAGPIERQQTAAASDQEGPPLHRDK
jgi:hypothetical protein